MHFLEEVNEVLVDTTILKAQPVRLLLAGIFDAMAKFVEIKQRFNGTAPIGSFSLGLDYAYMLAKGSYEVLVNNTKQAIEDMKKEGVSPILEQIFFTTICATGVISGIARGSNQSAIAHKFYETTRTLFPTKCKNMLHGEIVGVGLLLQNLFNGEKENNTPLIRFMKDNGMPYTPALLNIEVTDESKKAYAEKLISSSVINDEDAEEVAKYLACQEEFFCGRVE
jgi:glycerol dehydrogenase